MDGLHGQTHAGWEARLALEFEPRAGLTRLVRRSHHGPLAVQRPFHPEPDGTCHCYVLHPPGGLVAGDVLELDVRVGSAARVLLTTPAATKLYRSEGGKQARALQRLRVEAGARLEWLPQETIAYDAALARIETRVELAPSAQFIGCEVLCLGRPVRGERFAQGAVEQRLEVARDGVPLLIERARYVAGAAGAAPLAAAYGLHGQPVVGSLYCLGGREPSPELMAELRGLLSSHAGAGETAASTLAFALVCRYRGARVEDAQRALRAAWTLLRRECFESSAVAPRIWAT